ncbi:MAG: DUF1284 domain-containing protein [Archaeoglobaceae archaeon]|nr:DUF1284 domain-containing protein [Archaeoglobaceae archaeon]MCX8152643.1 DUF1284 domain-containing protein [Archaeoglobaceae archaeon]MDW8014075.1 DUF1284 domain-containing protein [Archaeoglobaceae archaeon]
MVKLRGHHLVCLNFFEGKGYDDRFVENLNRILKKLESGETIEIVDGIDDVCNACPYNKGFCSYKENFEEKIREMDYEALKLLKVEKTVKWPEIKYKVKLIMKDWKKYCDDCDWKEICLNQII